MNQFTTRDELNDRGYWFTTSGFAVPPNWLQFRDGFDVPVFQATGDEDTFEPAEPEAVRQYLRDVDMLSM